MGPASRPAVDRRRSRYAERSDLAEPSRSKIAGWCIFSAQARGVAHGSASASTGSAPRARNSFSISTRPHRHAHPSGVLLRRLSERPGGLPHRARWSRVGNPRRDRAKRSHAAWSGHSLWRGDAARSGPGSTESTRNTRPAVERCSLHGRAPAAITSRTTADHPEAVFTDGRRRPTRSVADRWGCRNMHMNRAGRTGSRAIR